MTILYLAFRSTRSDVVLIKNALYFFLDVGPIQELVLFVIKARCITSCCYGVVEFYNAGYFSITILAK